MEPDQHDHVEKTVRPTSNTAATAEELRRFMAEMRGKSPREVLGAVAESGLARGIFTSAICALVIIVVFTAGPYLINKNNAANAPAATTKPQPPSARSESKSTKATAQQQPAPESAPGEAAPKEADLEKASKAMGIGETKTADPDKNPLDSKLDSLLDGTE